MLFGVLGCPHCSKVQVVDAAAVTSHCRACRRSFQMADRKRFYVGDDPEEARRVVANVSLHVQRAPIEAMAEATAALQREETVSLQDVVARLEARPEFTLADVEDLLLQSRLTMTAARLVADLRCSHRVYEPRPGRFRWIG